MSPQPPSSSNQRGSRRGETSPPRGGTKRVREDDRDRRSGNDNRRGYRMPEPQQRRRECHRGDRNDSFDRRRGGGEDSRWGDRGRRPPPTEDGDGDWNDRGRPRDRYDYYDRDRDRRDRPEHDRERERERCDRPSRDPRELHGNRHDRDCDRDRRERPRGNVGRSESFDSSGWKCQECGLWNDIDYNRRGDEGICERCGFRTGPNGGGNDRRDRPMPRKKKEREWPPCFQNDTGGAFVLDARTGMFYDAVSDFFYDPKTKLYYSNKKKLYYEIDTDAEVKEKNEKPWFRPVDQQPEANDVEAAAAAAAGDVPIAAYSVPVQPSVKSDTKKIAISLKTKSLGSSKNTAPSNTNVAATTPAPVAGVLSQEQKKHFANMDVWSERGLEKRIASATEEVSPATPSSLAVNGATVIRTKTGKPVCLLCKRKFADLDKLRLHEEKSALHKHQLAASMEKEKAAAAVYRDRAKERRVMFEPAEQSTSVSRLALMQQQQQVLDLGLDKAREVVEAENVRPEESLGESNVGNKMLQKLGWSAGTKLGRESGDNSTGSNASKLQQDWERIEAMARNGGAGARKTGAQ